MSKIQGYRKAHNLAFHPGVRSCQGILYHHILRYLVFDVFTYSNVTASNLPNAAGYLIARPFPSRLERFDFDDAKRDLSEKVISKIKYTATPRTLVFIVLMQIPPAHLNRSRERSSEKQKEKKRNDRI